jgi:hypothetical protein
LAKGVEEASSSSGFLDGSRKQNYNMNEKKMEGLGNKNKSK